ncbi:MAG TPA: hypothetical protein VLA09_06460 [Longimicrobiales bacterium]|nr:hypothetical protein [Longimicrobiales bacterium]
MRAGALGRRGVLAALCVAGLLVARVTERASEERANRLHRAGSLADAASIYRDRLRADTAADRLSYNLGTTLLDLGSAAAEAELTRGARSPDDRLRRRALYNLGRWDLLRALEADVTDSARAQAARSVAANKLSLKLAPGHPNARWNLALAQRLLDSIDAGEGRAGTETVDGASSSDELIVSDELREFEEEGDVTDGPRQGADETPSRSDELDPLTVIEATEILRPDEQDATIMIRKLLSFEARAQRRLRSGRSGPRW